MGYPRHLLSEGEKIIAHKHPHFKMLIFPTLFGVVVLAAAIWGLVVAADFEPPWDMVAMIAIGAVAAVVLLWQTLAPFVRWRTTHFVVTTNRVKVREGVLRRTGVDIPMARINSVRFEHDLLDRIFGCGTLIIESASDEPLEFEDIPSVEKVHSWIYRQINDNPHDDFGAYDEPEIDEDDDFGQPDPDRRRRR